MKLCASNKKTILLSSADLKSIQKWVAALLDSSTQKKSRSAYLSVLILQMQNFQITEPFNKDPPKPLPDINKFFTVKFYSSYGFIVVIPFPLTQAAKLKIMMKEMDNKNMADLLKENRTPQSLSYFRTQYKTPAEFLDDQPMPLNGVIAYGGCFSNYFP